MSENERITVSGTVDASPDRVFAVLAEPRRHPEIDGSGLLRGLAEGEAISGPGATFLMDMNNSILGDYQVRCTVTDFEPDRRIGWTPSLHPDGGYADKLGDMKAGGQRFLWQLEPTAAGGTAITQTYDWSRVPDERFKAMMPFLTADQLQESIGRVGKAAG